MVNPEHLVQDLVRTPTQKMYSEFRMCPRRWWGTFYTTDNVVKNKEGEIRMFNRKKKV